MVIVRMLVRVCAIRLSILPQRTVLRFQQAGYLCDDDPRAALGSTVPAGSGDCAPERAVG
ncbi:conserved hypothetical protein [Aspergillus fumigatus A1163]|uniref:Uncharacterized protein n=1 Tax=Aspergillus fumigatus (strain CBS 144.89 / FGSC A1163 / CEA10) TaxID=451804 RepID=B0XVM5_ASPFC|nr:conserved hypothetical protein [Aspergillus fumigatus A1163]